MKDFNKYEIAFNKMVIDKKLQVFNKLSNVSKTEAKLEVGQKVTFTNEDGCVFPGHKILGFTEPFYEGGGCVYLDYDCYWFPAKVESLTIE